MASILSTLLCFPRRPSPISEGIHPAGPKMTHLPSESAAALTLESANSKPLESTTHSTPNILANASHESPTANSLSLYKQYSKSKMVYSDDETTIREKVVKIPKYSFGLDGTIVSAEGLVSFLRVSKISFDESLLTKALESLR
jgi:hypothetical protein